MPEEAPASERFTIRHAETERRDFGNYEYEILDRGNLIARYWHDSRGDDHWLRFVGGTEDVLPSGSMTAFISGGGPTPLSLTDSAKKLLHHHVERGEDAGR